MTTPDQPLRVELTFEMPGTPEQVWDAIATGPGISSWFLPTDVEPRVGGAIVTHMGETDSPGTVTAYEEPRRFAYEEPDWAALAGRAGAPVTPLATEFLVEARSGGTCVVRVVSAAFGTGADWEQEWLDEMLQGWAPFFSRLRLYLEHFAGEYAVSFATDTTIAASAAEVLAAMRAELGMEEPGRPFDARGLTGVVETVEPHGNVIRLTGDVRGFLGLETWDKGDQGAMTIVGGQLFGDDAADRAAAEEDAWRSWLAALDLKLTSSDSTPA